MKYFFYAIQQLEFAIKFLRKDILQKYFRIADIYDHVKNKKKKCRKL